MFTTLFRLSLNIASTRQILLHAYAATIIFTFGDMVVGGDIIVGVVVFLIIAVVQFIVIAKGAERVAEVGARFTLDAMPGKRMSIDADLRAAIIDKDEARLRRSQLGRESHLYGAMDGAMKFVKGDAIAGLVIAAVNILAGLAIGTLRKDMDMDTALRTYSVLTVGDALVSQVPSLFVSIAAGIITTRVSDPERRQGRGLGNEIAEQIRAHPKALLIASAVIFGLTWIPGFPRIPFLGLSLGIGALGYSLFPSRRRYASAGETPMPVMRREGTDAAPLLFDTSDHRSMVPVMVQIFAAADQILIPQRLQQELSKVRHYLTFDRGIPFPGMIIQPMARLPVGAYRMQINEIPVQDGELRPKDLLVLELQEVLARKGIKGEAGSSESLGRPVTWVHEGHRAQLAQAEFNFLGTEQILAQHLLQVLRRHADEFIGIQETQFLLKRLAEEYPDPEKELQRLVPLPRLTDVLKRLVREEISIRILRDIAHGLIEWAPREKDTILMTEYVRTCLSRFISHRFANSDGSLAAVILHPTVENQLRQSLRQTASGTMLMLDPATGCQLAEQIKQAVATHGRSKDAGNGYC